MTRGSLKFGMAALALLSFVGPDVAIAQYAGDPPYHRHRQAYNPHEGLQPNGCVKWCEFDMNPCDPPQYKTADGRCAFDR